MYKGSLSVMREMFIHLVFWLVWTYYSIVVMDAGSLYIGKMDLFYITGMIVYIITFYVNYLFVLPRVFRPFHWRKAVVGFLAVFIFFAFSRYLAEQVITLHWFGKRNYPADINLFYYLYDNLLYSSKPIILSTVLWSLIFLVRTLEYNRIILEENKNAEIRFLKAQINPHFIFNTLNNIYSMVYFKSDKSLQAIEKLSEIMRFTTYESPKEKIRLADEINYIKAYIELEKLRHEETGFVHFTCKMEPEDLEIPPYILSPLVENALKHGSSLHPIAITLNVTKYRLIFETQNEIGMHQKDKLGGIGLGNLEKRLEAHYPGTHRLQLTNENNRFTALLQLDLK